MATHPRGGYHRLAAVAAGGILLLVAADRSLPAAAEALDPGLPIKAELTRPEGRGFLGIYEARRYRSLWLEGGRLTRAGQSAVSRLKRAEDDGRHPSHYLGQEAVTLLQRAGGEPLDPRSSARLDLLLTAGVARFAHDLRRPHPANDTVRVSGAVGEGNMASSALERLSPDNSVRTLAALFWVNSDYQRLADALAEWRSLWVDLPRIQIASGPTLAMGDGDHRVADLRRRLGEPLGDSVLDQSLVLRLEAFQKWHGLPITGRLDPQTVRQLNDDPKRFEQRILTNMDRLRALPGETPDRHLRVNTAEAVLVAYEQGREVRRMRVVVGHPDTPTPLLEGRIQHLVLNPYWNIPGDLIRYQIAPDILKKSEAALTRRDLEVLSDWSSSAERLAATDVDWRAVAAGTARVRVRQRPGPDNMMGRVKFMLPNDLGIYLHDTPDRTPFAAEHRARSAGCVRVEDAEWLALWLTGPDVLKSESGRNDQRVEIAPTVPVFLTYQTIKPRPGGGLAVLADIYGRDGATGPDATGAL